MRTTALILVIAALGSVAAAPAGSRPGAANGSGLVYRYYAGLGYRFQPLLSFGNLNTLVSAHDATGARHLADALLARAVRRGDALYWTYDFPYGGAAAGWTSGFAQAVAAQALARVAVLAGNHAYAAAADAAFLGLRRTLLIHVAGGLWIREYSFSGQVILNAQLESVLAVEWYARLAKTEQARRVAAQLEHAARTLLPQFELGCWGRYELGGAAADVHYQTYHVDLLRRLARTHSAPIWRGTYLRWKACLP
jgi:hypothetical protein